MIRNLLRRFVRWYARRNNLVVRPIGLTLEDMHEKPVVDGVIYLNVMDFQEYQSLITPPSMIPSALDERFRDKKIYYKGYEVRPASTSLDLKGVNYTSHA